MVPPITIKDAHDLFDLRLLLEPAAAGRAAGNVDAEQLRRLDELCRAQYQPGNSEPVEAFLQANTEFHVTVARAAGNDLLAETIARVLQREERLNHLSHMLDDRNEAAYHKRHGLVDALIAGDAERSERVMAEGIIAARAFVLHALLSSPSIQRTNIVKPLV